MSFITDLLRSAAVSVLLFLALIWLLRNWISERLRNSIRHEYDQKIESYKAQLKAEYEVALAKLRSELEKEAAIQTAAHASFAAGQKAAMDRKLSAIDQIWNRVLYIRNNSPAILMFIDVLNSDEYKSVLSNPTFKNLTADLSLEKIAALVEEAEKKEGQIERARPYIGEEVWFLFFAYQAITMRIVVLLCLSQNDPSKVEWYKDSGVQQYLTVVLSKEEIKEFNRQQFGKILWLRRLIESKMLIAINKVISGEEFGMDSLKQSQRIAQISARLNREAKNALRSMHPTNLSP